MQGRDPEFPEQGLFRMKDIVVIVPFLVRDATRWAMIESASQ
jgi:hypothetical protein